MDLQWFAQMVNRLIVRESNVLGRFARCVVGLFFSFPFTLLLSYTIEKSKREKTDK